MSDAGQSEVYAPAVGIRLRHFMPVCLLLVVSRWGLHWTTGFVLDDWWNLVDACGWTTWGELVRTSLVHPTRPLSILYTFSFFRLLGEIPQAFITVSLLGNALCLYLVMRIVQELFGGIREAICAGCFFSLLPNLTETVHYPTIAIAAAGFVYPLCLGSGLCWLLFMRSRSSRWLVGSVLLYALGSFSYEITLFLPAAFLVVVPRKCWKQACRWFAPFALVCIAYLAWRQTSAFGMDYRGVPEHFKPSLDVLHVTANFKAIISIWMLDEFAGTLVNGLDGFRLQGRWWCRAMVLVNILVLWGTILSIRKAPETRPSANLRPGKGFFFLLVWSMASLIPCLFSYATPRLVFLSALGVSGLLGWGIVRLRWTTMTACWLTGGLLAMAANQGTAMQWKASQAAHRKLYAHLETNRPQWEHSSYIMLRTTQLNQRLTHGLLEPPRHDLSTVATYGNAGLFRGFTTKAMLRLIKRERPWPAVILDVEYGARLRQEEMIWHARFNDAKPEKPVPARDIFVVDVFGIISEKDRSPQG